MGNAVVQLQLLRLNDHLKLQLNTFFRNSSPQKHLSRTVNNDSDTARIFPVNMYNVVATNRNM